MNSVARILQAKASQRVHCVSVRATVFEALQLLAGHNVGALPVVDADGRLVGIFSERDYARKGVLQGRSSMTTRVEALMSAPVVSVTPQHSSQACMSLMSEMRLRHLPVLDEGRLVGLLSMGDLMQEVIREQDGLIHSLEQYIRGAA